VRHHNDQTELPTQIKHFCYYGALEAGPIEDVQYWLDQGVDVNYAGPDYNARCKHEPPAYIVVRRNDPLVAQLLIGHGLDVNARDEDHGESPLVFALHEGHYEIAIMLIEAGADLTVKNYLNRTPLEIVLDDGRPASHVLEAIKRRAPELIVDYWLDER
jgi:ankyrin repeat protein